MNKTSIFYDQKTKELLERSENIVNKSQMLSDLCVIQSKKVAELIEQSEKLTERYKEVSKEKE